MEVGVPVRPAIARASLCASRHSATSAGGNGGAAARAARSVPMTPVPLGGCIMKRNLVYGLALLLSITTLAFVANAIEDTAAVLDENAVMAPIFEVDPFWPKPLIRTMINPGLTLFNVW